MSWKKLDRTTIGTYSSRNNTYSLVSNSVTSQHVGEASLCNVCKNGLRWVGEPILLALRGGITSLCSERSAGTPRGQDRGLSLPSERRAWMKAGQCGTMSREAKGWGEEEQSEAKIPGSVGSWRAWWGRLRNLRISLKLLGNPGEVKAGVVCKEMVVLHNNYDHRLWVGQIWDQILALAPYKLCDMGKLFCAFLISSVKWA